MKEFVKAEDLLQLIANLDAEANDDAAEGTNDPEELAFYDGWAMCARNAIGELARLLDLETSTELDIVVELEDEDN